MRHTAFSLHRALYHSAQLAAVSALVGGATLACSSEDPSAPQSAAGAAGEDAAGASGSSSNAGGGAAGATVAAGGGAGTGTSAAGGSAGQAGPAPQGGGLSGAAMVGAGGPNSAGAGSSDSAGAGGSDFAGAGGSDSAGTGGSDLAGAGGSAEEGGSSGADGGGAGAATGADEPQPSVGCGQGTPASERYTIDVGGLSREYILSLPDSYDSSKPYRLIFTWHPWGGSAQQVAGMGASGYYGLKSASGGEAILVSPEGLDFGGNGLGWGNTDGQDIAFLEAMMERFDAELCFDKARVFSTGFSFGGMMSNAVGCSGLARAIAPMAGNSQVAGCSEGDKSVAYMGFHGDADTVVAPSGGEAARDVFVERNGCSTESVPSSPSWCEVAGQNYQPCECVDYQGCQEGYPVTWCSYTGGHMVAPNSGETLWNFFSQF